MHTSLINAAILADKLPVTLLQCSSFLFHVHYYHVMYCCRVEYCHHLQAGRRHTRAVTDISLVKMIWPESKRRHGKRENGG